MVINALPGKKTGLVEETDVRVRGRFYEALDHHFITTIATLTPSEEWLFVKKLNALLLLTT